MYRLTLVLICFFILNVCAVAEESGRQIEFKYSGEKDYGNKYHVYEGNLYLMDQKVYSNYLTFNLDGRYTYSTEFDSDHSNFDFYEAYLAFKTFEDKFAAKLGRFTMFNNKFMTVDGLSVDYRTDKKISFNLFGGVPKYITKDDRYIDDEFRSTGSKIFGLKVGVDDLLGWDGYLSYSREYSHSDVVQELLGGGLHNIYTYKDFKLAIDGTMDYELHYGTVYRMGAKASLQYKDRLTLLFEGDRFDVKDGYQFERKLIISNFSTGKEERYITKADVKVTDIIHLYGGYTRTYVKYSAGNWSKGEIYEAGTLLDMIKKYGLDFDLSFLRYDSIMGDANGFAGAMRWLITNNLTARVKSEYVKYDNWMDEDSSYTFYGDIAYRLTKKITTTLYVEKSNKVRYLPEYRYSLSIKYDF